MDESHKSIVKSGFDFLKQTKKHTQATVVRKIKELGFHTAESTFSNILKGKATGATALKDNADGMQKLLALECCQQWDEGAKVFVPIADCTPTEVLEWSEKLAYQQKGFTFYDKGRLPIAEKTRFFSTAKEEMVEFGLTLNTFTGYFFSRNEEEFKEPIYDLLRRGVNIKCYLLDPRSMEARLYFEDRKKYYIEEREGIGKIRTALANFKTILKEISEFSFPGKMEVFTYKHIPHQYILAVDPATGDGKLHVSHYLYGELRARCPVIECARADNASLFIRYRDSLEKLTRDAVKVTDFGLFLQ